MESEGEPADRPTSLRAPPPPDPGGGRATPPGSLNLRAGTRQLGTRTGAGRTREARKRGFGTGEPPTRHSHPPTRDNRPGQRKEARAAAGMGTGRAGARPDDRTPRDGSKTRNDVPPLGDTEEPDGKEARRPRAEPPRRSGFRRSESEPDRGGKGVEKVGGGPRRTQTEPPLLHLAPEPLQTPHSTRTRRDGNPGRASRRGHTHKTGRASRAGSPLLHSLPLMILPQVHLRKPCYDFYFL